MSDRGPLGDGDTREHSDLEGNKEDSPEKLHKGVSHGLFDSPLTSNDVDDFIEDVLPGDDV